MSAGLPFEIVLAIACEDIREEKSGKHTLVGVYSGDAIQISQIPGNMAIACFIEASVTQAGKHDMSIRISGPGDHEATLKARLEFPAEKGTAVIATPRVDLLVDSEGVFRMDISSNEQSWVNLITRQISLNPSLANERQQPSEQSQPDAPDSSSPPEPSPPSSPRKRRRI